MSRINTRDLPEWMNNFIATFSKDEKTTTASTEKVAEVNVKDLPKVVWNDETFYTMFDNGDATVLNEFGNTVTTIKGASTIEAVDQHLNGKQVVVSEKEASLDNVLEEELSKVSAYLAVEADDQQNPNGQQQNGQPAQPGQQQQAPQDEFGAPAPADNSNGGSTEQTPEEVDNLENDVNSTTASLEMAAKFAAMEDQVQTLTKQVTALTEQLRGYQDPGAVYDLNVGPAEQQHFEESAQQSAQEIEKEHGTDLTTMQGRVSLVDKIMEDIDTIMDATELNVDEQELNDLNDIEVEDPTVEEDETPGEDDLVELDIPDVEVETPEETDTPDVEVVEVDEDPAADDDSDKKDDSDVEEVEEPKDDKKEDKGEDKKEDDDEDIVKLNSRDSKIFKERICPSCGEKMLTLSNKVAHMQGVYCKGCKAEYGVDTNTESIYKKA